MPLRALRPGATIPAALPDLLRQISAAWFAEAGSAAAVLADDPGYARRAAIIAGELNHCADAIERRLFSE